MPFFGASKPSRYAFNGFGESPQQCLVVDGVPILFFDLCGRALIERFGI